MPKLKVPSATKPAKRQLTLLLKRRPLHSSSPEKSSEATPQASFMEKPGHLGRVPGAMSPKKQNGLKPSSKSFTDTFGVSDDEVSEPTS